jgi:hypothetical protein
VQEHDLEPVLELAPFAAALTLSARTRLLARTIHEALAGADQAVEIV